MRRIACALSIIGLVFTLSCKKQQSNQSASFASDTMTRPAAPAPAPEAPDTAPAARSFGFDQRQDFVQSIRQQLAGIDQQITDLANQAKSRGGAVSDRALANIRTSRRAVDRSLNRVEAATVANWEQVKQGVNRSVDNLSEAIEAAQPK